MAKTKPTTNGTATSDILTLAEAAAFLKVSEAGLQTDAESGRIPAKLIAGEWRFSRAGILQWLNQWEPLGTDSSVKTSAKTGKDIAERIRAIRAESNSSETLEEVEEFIQSIYKARKQPLA